MKGRTALTLCTLCCTSCALLAGFEAVLFVDTGSDGSTSDAAFDGSTADATLDGRGPDAAVDGCAHDFCDDFEGVRTVQGEWTGLYQQGTATLRLDGGVLFAHLARTFDPNGHYAVLEFDKPWTLTDAGARRRTHVTFRARVDACPPRVHPFVQLTTTRLNGLTVDLQIGNQADTCVANIQIVDYAGPVFTYSPTLLVQLGAWQTYELEIAESVSAAGGTATMRLDGVARSISVPPKPDPTKFVQTFGLGQGSNDGADAAVALDDFTLDYLR